LGLAAQISTLKIGRGIFTKTFNFPISREDKPDKRVPPKEKWVRGERGEMGVGKWIGKGRGEESRVRKGKKRG